MIVKTVTYSKVFSLGNFENEKIGTEVEITSGDDVQSVIQKAREFVEFNHKLNGYHNEIAQCEHVMNNPDDFTGSQIKRATETWHRLNNAIADGTKLLSI